MNNPLSDMFKHLLDSNKKFKPVAHLSEEDAKEWESIQHETSLANSLCQEAKVKELLFLIKTERKLDLFNTTLKIENNMVLKEIKDDNNSFEDFRGYNSRLP